MQDVYPKQHSFMKVFLSYSSFLLFGVMFSYIGLFLSLPELMTWRDKFVDLPSTASFFSGDLYLVVLMIPALYVPIAFFPEQWSSLESSRKRIAALLWILALSVLMNVYLYFMLEKHLQGQFLPQGYVQCEVDGSKQGLIMQTYEFAKDATLCQAVVQQIQ
jgi:hypothetical protein